MNIADAVMLQNRILNYTSAKQHYTAEFKMTETDDNVICVFNFGGADSAGEFSVNVENLSMIRIS